MYTSTPPRRIHLPLAAFLLKECVDHILRSKSTSRKLFGPSAFPAYQALLVTPLAESASNTLLGIGGVTYLRVWLPSRRVLKLRKPWEASFSSQRSWASSFRAFFLSSDRSEGFPSPLRSCALLQNLYDLVVALQRLSPTGKAVSLLAPRRFRSGRNRSCSPGPFSLLGSPSANPLAKSSPLPKSPSRLSSSSTLR